MVACVVVNNNDLLRDSPSSEVRLMPLFFRDCESNGSRSPGSDIPNFGEAAASDIVTMEGPPPTLINETLGDEDLRRGKLILMFEVDVCAAEGNGGVEVATAAARGFNGKHIDVVPVPLVSRGSPAFAAGSGPRAPGGGAAAAIMAMMPMPGLATGMGTPIPLGFRLMAIPIPTGKFEDILLFDVGGGSSIKPASSQKNGG